MNILIVKLSAIGDVIHTLPALNALRDAYPQGRITWLIEEAAADLVIGHPALDRVLVVPRKDWLRRFRAGHGGMVLREVAAFVRRLRDTRYDLILDFQALLKSSFWIALARGDRRAGFGPGMAHMESSWIVLNERIPAVSMEIHALERNLLMLRALGIPADTVDYRLPIRDAHRRRIARLLGDHGGRPLVALNPAAKWPTKLWQPEKFAALADQVAGAWDATILFTGAPDDRALIDAIIGRMTGPCTDTAGRTSLMELAALFERCRVVVTTDTGPMHLAAAVGVPTVALFGPTAPWRTGPHGTGHRIVRAGVACSPCFKRDCRQPECMTRLSVDQVTAAVDDVMTQTG